MSGDAFETKKPTSLGMERLARRAFRGNMRCLVRLLHIAYIAYRAGHSQPGVWRWLEYLASAEKKGSRLVEVWGRKPLWET